MDASSTAGRVLLVIPARGGSQRLAGKNLRPLGGLPLVARTVLLARQAAVRLGGDADVVVTTDDARIAEVARTYGAPPPFQRPACLATDTATSVATLRHALDQMLAHGRTYASVVLLQCTSPFGSVADILDAIALHRQHPGDSVVSVCPATAGVTNSYRWVKGVLHDPAGGTTDATLVRLTGAVYVCSPAWLTSHDTLCRPTRTRGVRVPVERGIDIDTQDDFTAAEQQWRDRILWPPDRCTVIAEAGVNHNGDLGLARALIDAAAAAGADAVKFQAFSPEQLVTATARKAGYQARTTDADESQRAMLARLALPATAFAELKAYSDTRGVGFLCSPFGPNEVDALIELGVPAIKLGSGEITNHPLLGHAAATGRPILLSTGASHLNEVRDAVAVLRHAGCVDLALMHCVSSYPADPADANLRAMATMRAALDVPVGFSDHTPGSAVSIAAAALGAALIEKHLTLDHRLPGPDHAASLEPDAFAALVTGVRAARAALGDGTKTVRPSEIDVRRAARRSLVAIRDLPIGTVLQAADLVAKRAGTGISPAELPMVCGQCLTAPLACDEVLNWTQLHGHRGRA